MMASNCGDQALTSLPLKSFLAGSRRRMSNMAKHTQSGSLIQLAVACLQRYSLWILLRVLMGQRILVSSCSGFGTWYSKYLERISQCYGMILDESQLLRQPSTTLFLLL